MLSVQNYRVTPARVAFKGNDENQVQTQPFKTHAGLKTGTVYATICALSALGTNKIASAIGKIGEEVARENADEIGEQTAREIRQNSKAIKTAIGKSKYTIPLSIAVSLACGAIVDSVINKKQDKFAQKVNENGKNATLQEEDRAELTKRQNIYYNSNTGKKLGTLLGMVALPALNATTKAIAKAKGGMGILSSAIIGTIGGFILGAITDACANKAAKKHADKQALAAVKAAEIQ